MKLQLDLWPSRIKTDPVDDVRASIGEGMLATIRIDSHAVTFPLWPCHIGGASFYLVNGESLDEIGCVSSDVWTFADGVPHE